MKRWRLWTYGETYKTISISPKLESWNAKSDPAQQALQAYLDDLERELTPLPSKTHQLFLHMDICVQKQEHLISGHDLDNYLFPVVRRLGSSHFTYVSATKRLGGDSQLLIGLAKPSSEQMEQESWQSFWYPAGSGYQKSEWKKKLRYALKTAPVQPIGAGLAEIQLLWRCSSGRNWGQPRNWANLWKPTIDALGPILGEPFANRPFYPNDDRIASLALHLNIDDTMDYAVDVGISWRSAPAEL